MPDVNMFDWKQKIDPKYSLRYTINWKTNVVVMHCHHSEFQLMMPPGLTGCDDVDVIVTTSLFENIIKHDSYVNYGILEMKPIDACVLKEIALANVDNIVRDQTPIEKVKTDCQSYSDVIDVFASRYNNYYDRYCCWYKDNFFGLTSVDASVLYVFPPMIECIINRIPEKLAELNVRAVVIVPAWGDNPGITKLLGMATTVTTLQVHAYGISQVMTNDSCVTSDDISKKQIEIFVITLGGDRGLIKSIIG